MYKVKSIDNKISSELKKIVLPSQNRFFSCSVAAVSKGRLVYNYRFGKDYLYYDLASMTKAIFTGLYFLKANKNASLISDIVPWLFDTPTRIGGLLSHTSGLNAHEEYYKKLIKSKNWDLDLKKLLREDSKKLQTKSPLYSDLGYLMLYYAIQELEETKNLEYIFEQLKSDFKLSEGFHFNSLNKPKFKRSLYAPTEKCKWRKKLIRGEVFDDNTWAMQGVSTHAGLFGSLSDMIDFYKVLKKNYSSQKMKTVAPGWTYGFMKPSGATSTAGRFFSKDSIGHLGFTGVSFWYDPKVDFFVTLLSNRTFPNRDNNKFNSFRPWIHDLLYKEYVNEQPKLRKI